MYGVTERGVQGPARRAHDVLPDAGHVAEAQDLVERLRVRRLQPLAQRLLQVTHEPTSNHFEFRLNSVYSGGIQ